MIENYINNKTIEISDSSTFLAQTYFFNTAGNTVVIQKDSLIPNSENSLWTILASPLINQNDNSFGFSAVLIDPKGSKNYEFRITNFLPASEEFKKLTDYLSVKISSNEKVLITLKKWVVNYSFSVLGKKINFSHQKEIYFITNVDGTPLPQYIEALNLLDTNFSYLPYQFSPDPTSPNLFYNKSFAEVKLKLLMQVWLEAHLPQGSFYQENEKIHAIFLDLLNTLSYCFPLEEGFIACSTIVEIWNEFLIHHNDQLKKSDILLPLQEAITTFLNEVKNRYGDMLFFTLSFTHLSLNLPSEQDWIKKCFELTFPSNSITNNRESSTQNQLYDEKNTLDNKSSTMSRKRKRENQDVEEIPSNKKVKKEKNQTPDLKYYLDSYKPKTSLLLKLKPRPKDEPENLGENQLLPTTDPEKLARDRLLNLFSYSYSWPSGGILNKGALIDHLISAGMSLERLEVLIKRIETNLASNWLHILVQSIYSDSPYNFYAKLREVMPCSEFWEMFTHPTLQEFGHPGEHVFYQSALCNIFWKDKRWESFKDTWKLPTQILFLYRSFSYTDSPYHADIQHDIDLLSPWEQAVALFALIKEDKVDPSFLYQALLPLIKHFHKIKSTFEITPSLKNHFEEISDIFSKLNKSASIEELKLAFNSLFEFFILVEFFEIQKQQQGRLILDNNCLLVMEQISQVTSVNFSVSNPKLFSPETFLNFLAYPHGNYYQQDYPITNLSSIKNLSIELKWLLSSEDSNYEATSNGLFNQLIFVILNYFNLEKLVIDINNYPWPFSKIFELNTALSFLFKLKTLHLHFTTHNEEDVMDVINFVSLFMERAFQQSVIEEVTIEIYLEGSIDFNNIKDQIGKTAFDKGWTSNNVRAEFNFKRDTFEYISSANNRIIAYGEKSLDLFEEHNPGKFNFNVTKTLFEISQIPENPSEKTKSIDFIIKHIKSIADIKGLADRMAAYYPFIMHNAYDEVFKRIYVDYILKMDSKNQIELLQYIYERVSTFFFQSLMEAILLDYSDKDPSHFNKAFIYLAGRFPDINLENFITYIKRWAIIEESKSINFSSSLPNFSSMAVDLIKESPSSLTITREFFLNFLKDFKNLLLYTKDLLPQSLYTALIEKKLMAQWQEPITSQGENKSNSEKFFFKYFFEILREIPKDDLNKFIQSFYLFATPTDPTLLMDAGFNCLNQWVLSPTEQKILSGEVIEVEKCLNFFCFLVSRLLNFNYYSLFILKEGIPLLYTEEEKNTLEKVFFILSFSNKISSFSEQERSDLQIVFSTLLRDSQPPILKEEERNVLEKLLSMLCSDDKISCIFSEIEIKLSQELLSTLSSQKILPLLTTEAKGIFQKILPWIRGQSFSLTDYCLKETEDEKNTLKIGYSNSSFLPTFFPNTSKKDKEAPINSPSVINISPQSIQNSTTKRMELFSDLLPLLNSPHREKANKLFKRYQAALSKGDREEIEETAYLLESRFIQPYLYKESKCSDFTILGIDEYKTHNVCILRFDFSIHEAHPWMKKFIDSPWHKEFISNITNKKDFDFLLKWSNNYNGKDHFLTENNLLGVELKDDEPISLILYHGLQSEGHQPPADFNFMLDFFNCYQHYKKFPNFLDNLFKLQGDELKEALKTFFFDKAESDFLEKKGWLSRKEEDVSMPDSNELTSISPQTNSDFFLENQINEPTRFTKYLINYSSGLKAINDFSINHPNNKFVNTMNVLSERIQLILKDNLLTDDAKMAAIKEACLNATKSISSLMLFSRSIHVVNNFTDKSIENAQKYARQLDEDLEDSSEEGNWRIISNN